MTSQLSNIRVLLVEDQPIIAMDIEFILSDHGVGATETAATATEAIALIAAAEPDIAILDFNLRSGNSLPVAEELATKEIPFIFTTGYGDNSMIPKKFAHVPVITKPYDPISLIEVLSQVLAEVS